ncbi:MAG: sporulation protein YqfD [Firmicutes bacterium]|nr:sporulation protein YqfD [Bacillota bacterium]
MSFSPERWWKGQLQVAVSGPQPERFLNLALSRGLTVTGVAWDGQGRLRLWLELPDAARLPELCRLSHCRFQILRRRGRPFLLALWGKRPALLAAVFLSLAALLWLSSLILSLEVTSPYPLETSQKQRILQLAAEAGVKPYISRCFIDLEEAESHILSNEPDLLFAEIEERGSHLRINVVYRVNVAAGEETRPPGDIVAAAGGVIRSILVQKGTAAVSAGQAVRQGQVLISGQVGNSQVAAAGMIVAEIWRDGYGEYPLSAKVRENSGRVSRRLSLRLGHGPSLTLWGKEAPPFAIWQTREEKRPLRLWRKMTLPIELTRKEYFEQNEKALVFTSQQAQERAACAAWNAAFFLLPPQAAVEDWQNRVLPGDGDLARAHVRLSAACDIGVFRPGVDEAAAPSQAGEEND